MGIAMESGGESTERAWGVALRLLAYRPRSQREVRLRLQRRFGDAIAEAVVGRLLRSGLLDDEAFARFWQESRERVRPRSRAIVRQELLEKGVAPAVVEEAVAQVNDEEAALQAGRRYLRRLQGADYPTFRRKLGPYLQRRGFPGDVVRHTLARLWREGPSRSEGAKSLILSEEHRDDET